jgi:hypothetical protein
MALKRETTSRYFRLIILKLLATNDVSIHEFIAQHDIGQNKQRIMNIQKTNRQDQHKGNTRTPTGINDNIIYVRNHTIAGRIEQLSGSQRQLHISQSLLFRVVPRIIYWSSSHRHKIDAVAIALPVR